MNVNTGGKDGKGWRRFFEEADVETETWMRWRERPGRGKIVGGLSDEVRLQEIDGWAKGHKRKDKSVEEDIGWFQASVFPSVKTNSIMRGSVGAGGAWWEASVLSYGSAGGIYTRGTSCGNHCSVGRWAGAIRPPASHQLSSVPSSWSQTRSSSTVQHARWITHLPSFCCTHNISVDFTKWPDK